MKLLCRIFDHKDEKIIIAIAEDYLWSTMHYEVICKWCKRTYYTLTPTYRNRFSEIMLKYYELSENDIDGVFEQIYIMGNEE